MCVRSSGMLRALTFDSQQHEPVIVCLQVATDPISLDDKLVQWVCADFREALWLSEMQLGSIPQWTSVLVSLLLSGSFPASALILLGLNLTSTTLSFFLLLPLFAQCSLLPIPPLYIYTSFCLCLRCTVSSRGHREGHKEMHRYIFVYLSHSFYLLPPLSELGPVGVCVTWPLLQGTSVSPLLSSDTGMTHLPEG